jgi:hypothetical protein
MRPRTEIPAAQVGAIHRAMLAAPGKPCKVNSAAIQAG